MVNLPEGIHDDSGTMVAEGTETVVALGLGSPVEDTLTVPSTMVAGHINDSRQDLLTFYRFCRFNTRLNHQHGFAILSPKAIDICRIYCL